MIAKYQILLFLGLAVINLTVYPAATISSELSTIEALQEKQEKERQLRQFSQTGSIFMVDSLIAEGVDVNSPDTNGNTSLMNAAKSGYEQIVQALIKAGADIDATNARGETALILAILKNHTNVARMLVEAKKHNNPNISSNVDALLFVAVTKNNDKIIPSLLAAGADVNAADAQGFSPLIRAIINKNGTIVKQLLFAGADINNIYELLAKALKPEDSCAYDERVWLHQLMSKQEYENQIKKHNIEKAKSTIKPEILKLLESEPGRRIQLVKKRQEAVEKLTSAHLLPDLSTIAAQYATHDYEDIPVTERL